jgi:hypothetical protein
MERRESRALVGTVCERGIGAHGAISASAARHQIQASAMRNFHCGICMNGEFQDQISPPLIAQLGAEPTGG